MRDPCRAAGAQYCPERVRSGLKILVSGGGAAFTNMWEEPTDHYLSANEHFTSRHATLFTMGFYRHGQSPWYRLRKKLGQPECDHSAQDIVDMLLAEAADAGVTVRLKHEVIKYCRHAAGISSRYQPETEIG